MSSEDLNYRPTRLNARAMASLRQRASVRSTPRPRATIDARDVRVNAPRQPRDIPEDDELSESDSDEWETDSEEEEDVKDKVLCCYCCTPHVMVMLFILALTAAGWSLAVYYGIIKPQSSRRERQPITWASIWPYKPSKAEDAFTLFDRDGDGFLGLTDIEWAAERTKGEKPSPEQLRKYIQQADRDGDGLLDENEYLDLLYKEREQRARAQGSDSAPPEGG